MAAIDRLKQVLMGIGLLTVLAVGAFAGLMVYIWWDSRSAGEEEFTAETDYETDDETDSFGDVTADDDETTTGVDDGEATAD